MDRPNSTALELPSSIPDPFHAALAGACQAWIAHFGSDLVSLVLFGSVARGTTHERSDIDLLVVAKDLPRSLADRRRPLLDLWRRVREERDLPAVEWNLLTKSVEEARHHSPVYLDMVEEAVLLLDREAFFAEVLATMRTRMRELGSRRVFLSDGSWYWDLKPDFRFGEVVEI